MKRKLGLAGGLDMMNTIPAMAGNIESLRLRLGKDVDKQLCSYSVIGSTDAIIKRARQITGEPWFDSR